MNVQMKSTVFCVCLVKYKSFNSLRNMFVTYLYLGVLYDENLTAAVIIAHLECVYFPVVDKCCIIPHNIRLFLSSFCEVVQNILIMKV